jgi:hypothetical protein
MISVQLSIRADFNHGASLVPMGADSSAGAFSVYAIATAKGLIQEMKMRLF